ncbi:MAG: S8 family serine peptidase [Nitrosopumilus sp.]|nr:S8 family serine peptidase [Nitrosopumilus sp.]
MDLDGSGVKVAVIDHGIDHTTAFKKDQITRRFCDNTGCDGVTGRIHDFGSGGSSHGLFSGQIIAASNLGSNNGIAPGVELFDIVYTYIDGVDQSLEDRRSSFVHAIDWAFDNGVDIANLSLNGRSSCTGDNNAFDLIANEAVDKGMILVGAVSNTGSGSEERGDPILPKYSSVLDPACAHNVIGVGGINDRDNPVVMYNYSGRGPVTKHNILKPDLVAPGVDIQLLMYNDREIFQPVHGTSVATPFVTATAALMLDARPDLTPVMTKAALLPGPGGPTGSPQASCGAGHVLLETTRGSHACVEEGRADVLISRGFEPAPWTASYPHMASPARVAEPRGLAAENNGFAVDMYRILARDGGNVFFSPISLYLSFAALHEGAGGETGEEIRRAFGLEMDAGDRRAEARDLVTRLEAWNPHKSMTSRSYVFIYDEPGAESQLREDIRDAYRTSVEFYGDGINLGGGMDLNDGIRHLVEFATDGAITTILSGNDYVLTDPVLLNPAYLAAEWDIWFPGDAAYHAHWMGDVRTVRTEKVDTQGVTYNEHRLGGENDSAPLEFMRQPECACWHRDIGDGEVIWLPLGGGLSMLAVIPHESRNLASVEEGLTTGDLTGLTSGLRPEKIDLYMPRFTTESHMYLRSSLEELGISAVFDEQKADLGGIVPEHIGRVVQKAVMETDRKGVYDPPAMSWIQGDRELVMDRPFLFAVLDDATGAVLFMGRMAEPAAGVVATFEG